MNYEKLDYLLKNGIAKNQCENLINNLEKTLILLGEPCNEKNYPLFYENLSKFADKLFTYGLMENAISKLNDYNDCFINKCYKQSGREKFFCVSTGIFGALMPFLAMEYGGMGFLGGIISFGSIVMLQTKSSISRLKKDIMNQKKGNLRLLYAFFECDALNSKTPAINKTKKALTYDMKSVLDRDEFEYVMQRLKTATE